MQKHNLDVLAKKDYTENKMKQKKNKKRIFGWGMLGVFGVGTIAAILGLSSTMAEIANKTIAKTPDAILASAGVSEEKVVSVPVLYYDQKMDDCVNLYDAGARDALHARQFEWSECEYYNKELEQGLVEFELSEDYLPVATGLGSLTANRGVDFGRWFDTVEGKSISYAGTLGMKYQANGAEFSFLDEDFYPLDEVQFSDGDIVNRDGHNHLFTMNFAVPFTVLASGEEEFEIVADDDTFVFVGDKLVLDMGGIHEAMNGHFVVHEDGEIYAGVDRENLAYSGVSVAKGDGSIVRIYHADRDSDDSIFKVRFSGMNLSVTNVEFASNDGGVQIAYDPSNPTYVAPLGETSVFRPDSTKGLIIMATIEGILVMVAAVSVALVAGYMVKQKTDK